MAEGCAGELFALGGVVLGFALGEGSRFVRRYLEVKSAKKIVRTELVALKAQIAPKKDILNQAIAKLSDKQILPTSSVRFITHGYENKISEIYSALTKEERQSLHVIYEYLRVADLTMDKFESEIMALIEKGVMNDPYKAFRDRFVDIMNTLNVAERLIDAYLDGNPPDVFAR